MKKLMFVAAVAASCVAVADDVASGFDGAGVYNVSISEKTLETTFAQVECLEPSDGYEYGFESKAEAKQAGEDAWADIAAGLKEEGIGYKLKSISTKKDSEEGWGYQIKYLVDSDEVKGAKTVNKTVNGLLFKGIDGIEDGALLLWYKDKLNRDDNGLYYAYSMTEDQASVVGSIVANKAVGGFEINLTDLDGKEIQTVAAGIGTSVKDADGDYSDIKSISGNVASAIESEKLAYGTWKIQKDAQATKYATVKGYSLSQILRTKGAVEIND